MSVPLSASEQPPMAIQAIGTQSEYKFIVNVFVAIAGSV